MTNLFDFSNREDINLDNGSYAAVSDGYASLNGIQIELAIMLIEVTSTSSILAFGLSESELDGLYEDEISDILESIH